MFYAFYDSYAVGARDKDYGRRTGALHIFRTKADRDAWVEEDRWEGSHLRKAMGYREARPFLVDLASICTCRPPAECRARGAKWMCKEILRSESLYDE